MRNLFDEQLSKLNDMLVEMGTMVEKSISRATCAIIDNNKKKAKKAIKADKNIDQLEKDIESLCLSLLLRHQPVASDLRFISAALKMITDMERIGDQAADISEIARYLTGMENRMELESIPIMADLTSKMVTESIDAFVKRDLELAQKVIGDDDMVDGLFDKVKSDVIAVVRKEPNYSAQAIDLMMVAKYYERIGDHATNIAEWVVFAITGRHIDSEIEIEVEAGEV